MSDITAAEFRDAVRARSHSGPGDCGEDATQDLPFSCWWQYELSDGSLASASGRGKTRTEALAMADASSKVYASRATIDAVVEEFV